MQPSAVKLIIRQIPWILLAAVVGAVVFEVVQKIVFGGTISQFIGATVVEQGGYNPAMQVPIGWGVHLGVSISYAALFGIIAAFFSANLGVRWILALILAAFLGWVTTLITQPAIGVTISVLSGQGWPAELPPLNTEGGLPLWNHMGFFGICFLFIVLVPDLLRGPSATCSR